MSFGDEHARDLDPLAAWPAFAAAVRARLEQGRIAYGERSFQRAPGELLGELSQEAQDLAGWGFVLFERIERMRMQLAVGDQRPTDAVDPSEAPRPRSVHLAGFTPETLERLGSLATRLQLSPGQVVAIAVQTLAEELERSKADADLGARLTMEERGRLGLKQEGKGNG